MRALATAIFINSRTSSYKSSVTFESVTLTSGDLYLNHSAIWIYSRKEKGFGTSSLTNKKFKGATL
jgi:hypothetical protein